MSEIIKNGKIDKEIITELITLYKDNSDISFLLSEYQRLFTQNTTSIYCNCQDRFYTIIKSNGEKQ